MFGREVNVCSMFRANDSHHFIDTFANEEVALKSLRMSVGDFEVEEERIGQMGVVKKIHCTPFDVTKKVTIVVGQPTTEAYQLSDLVG